MPRRIPSCYMGFRQYDGRKCVPNADYSAYQHLRQPSGSGIARSMYTDSDPQKPKFLLTDIGPLCFWVSSS